MRASTPPARSPRDRRAWSLVVRPAGFTKAVVSVYVALLVPGVTLDQLKRRHVAADDAEARARSSLGLVSIQASVALDPADKQRAATFTVKPGLTYYVLVEQDVDKGSRRGRSPRSPPAAMPTARPPRRPRRRSR